MGNFRSFLWDTTTYFISGVVILLNIIFYNRLDTIRTYVNIDIFSGEIIRGIYLIIITYTIGVFYEPIANVIFRLLAKPYSKFPWNKNLERIRKERDDIYMPKVRQIIQDSYQLKDNGTDYYQVAKAYLYRKGIPQLYNTFLSRFGLYRNLTVLVLGNIFLTIWFNRHDLLDGGLIFSVILLVIIHQLLFSRARQFYFYTGNEICRHFILEHDNPVQSVQTSATKRDRRRAK